VIVAFGTAIYLRKRIAALGFLVACYVGALWLPDVVSHQPAPSAIFALSLGVGLAFMVGVFEAFRLRQQWSMAKAHGKEEEARRRATEERMRIARELHDIVAHNISVINVQANTALHLMDRQPERARSALQTINDVSKQALVELRSVLGVLRAVDEDAPRSPAPSLAHLDELLESARAAGLAVAVEEIGVPQPLPSEVDLAAYRIIQEALTNTARHSGSKGAVVRVSYGEHDLVIEVDDDGARQAPASSNGSGSGILGMGERVAALGGHLEAGAKGGGGFRVRACVPIRWESPK
jgi:signal transduction histidine kinase